MCFGGANSKLFYFLATEKVKQTLMIGSIPFLGGVKSRAAMVRNNVGVSLDAGRNSTV
jgi:hypothetical protein